MSSKDQIQNTFRIELVYGLGSSQWSWIQNKKKRQDRQCTYNI